MKKRMISLILSMCLLVPFLGHGQADYQVTATPSNVNINIDGKLVDIPSYNINGSNYFKLRDLAMAFNDTSAPFQVLWDDNKKQVNILTKTKYTPIGGELAVENTASSATAIFSPHNIMFDGRQVRITAFVINGANYLPFGYLMDQLNVGVDWNVKSNTIFLNTIPDPTEKDKLNIVVGSHASWPYIEDWGIWKWMEEACGTELNIQAVPDCDMPTKINLMSAAGMDTMPDLIYAEKRQLSTGKDAFIAVSDNLDKMPNYERFMDSLPLDERKELESQRRSSDGKIYAPPVYGTQEVVNLRTWMHRKDIFERHGLQPPTTQTELYNVCKSLKSLYPYSYPFCFRSGLDQINVMAPMWKNDFSLGIYYDFKQEKWCWGAQDTLTMTAIINFFHKMADEKLVPPDYLTITSKCWEELVSTDRGFIMPEYLVRIDFFNEPNRQQNPDYTWAIMEPPKGDGQQGQSKIAKLNMDGRGYVICNTGKQKQIEKAISFVDWLYSDDASELVSWGKENQSYTVDKDGNKSYILENQENLMSKYGIGTNGTFQRITSYSEGYSREQSEQGKLAYQFTEDHVNPALWLSFNNKEMETIDNLESPLLMFTDEMISKFLYKQHPMSEWDSFQKSIKDMGVEQLLGIYTTAYNRAMGK